MSLKKIYIIIKKGMDLGFLTSNNHQLYENAGKYDKVHYGIFANKLQAHTTLQVELRIVESFLELPEDGLIITYAHEQFWEDYYQHPQHKQLAFARRFFLIGMFLPPEYREKLIIFSHHFRNHSFIGSCYPIAYSQSLDSDIPSNIPRYYDLDILAIEDVQKLWKKRRKLLNIKESYLEGTPYIPYKPINHSIKELCIFLEEYAEKFDFLKQIDHFNNLDISKKLVLKYQRENNYFKRFYKSFKNCW